MIYFGFENGGTGVQNRKFERKSFDRPETVYIG